MIQVRHLSVCYGAVPALQDITLDVQAGEFVLLTGPSGCGKSTLARAMCGLIPHALPARMQGSVRVAGVDTRETPLPTISQQVGIVFQNPSSQLFHLRVEDEVMFGPRNLGWDEDEIRQQTAWALDTTGLTALRDCKPAELSAGQKQCLAIAAVLAMRPRLLVLDEPTASLDAPSTRRVMHTLGRLQRQHGITIVLIEHRLAQAARLANRALVMHKGRIVADGNPAQVFADRHIRKTLGLRRPVDAPLAAWDTLIQANAQCQGQAPPLLTLDKVSAGYGRRAVIQDVDLTLYPGDFAALVGHNGAGKSTLALVAAGLLKPLGGRVRYGGGKRPRPGLDVALLFQNPVEQLFTDSVDKEVAFGPRNYDRFDAAQHVETLTQTGLAGLRARCPMMLSAGQQQRTALAACLALRPRLMILDEPTLGQDWGHLERLMDFLLALNRQGTAILLISHDYKLIHHYARRAILMEHGRIKLNGTLTASVGARSPRPIYGVKS
jgi:energy-coupling factor transporter ATP-binding protein EcfA2